MKNQLSKYLLILLFALIGGIVHAQTTPNFAIVYTPTTPCTNDTLIFTVVDLNGVVNLSTTSTEWVISDGYYGITQTNTLRYTFGAGGFYEICALFINPYNMAPDTVCVTITVDAFCGPHDLIEGTIYMDANNNGAQDIGEIGLPYGTILVNPGGQAFTANWLGEFSFLLPAGSYTLSCVPLPYTSVSQPVGNSIPITSTGSAIIQGGNSFGLAPTPNQQDVMVHLATYSASPGFNMTVEVMAVNLGTQVQSGQIEVTLDPNVTLLPGLLPGWTYSGGVLTIPYSNLQPNGYAGFGFFCNVSTSQQIGDTLTYSALVTPLAGDLAPANNYDTLREPIVASFDPNDKRSRAVGMGPNGEINAGDELVYTIRFQNEGNFPATFIFIRDTLDPELDYSSFRVIGSSHPMTPTLAGDKVQFFFNDIQLVPKSQDSLASQGFVSYRIKAKNSLAPGDSVTNTASIYFDYNPPVVTNTTVNTVWVAIGIEDGVIPIEIELFPNPMQDRATLRFDAGGESWDLTVTDLQGRSVMARTEVRNGEIQIQRGDLASGTYLFQLVSETGKTASGKLIAQ